MSYNRFLVSRVAVSRQNPGLMFLLYMSFLRAGGRRLLHSGRCRAAERLPIIDIRRRGYRRQKFVFATESMRVVSETI